MNSDRRRRSIPSLPDGKRVQLFRAIEGILRDDPVLSRPAVVKTWRSFEGEADAFANPVPDECPWARLKLLARPIVPAGQTRVMLEVAVQIDLAVRGTCQDDLVNLWEAFEDALFSFKPYRGTTVEEFLRVRAFSGYTNLAVGPANPTGLPGVHGGLWGGRFEEPPLAPAGGFNPNAPGQSPEVTMLAGSGRYVGNAYKPA